MNPSVEKINYLGQHGKPFVFIIDFSGNNWIVIDENEFNHSDIWFDINGFSNNIPTDVALTKEILFEKFPQSLNEYRISFEKVMQNLKVGNSYLTNLTCETPIETNLNLSEIFDRSNAVYKLLYKNKFVVFSPECFVKIRKGRIFSFPMKGTIDANFPNAENLILKNKKETAEHVTIVDLIRNDLSRVATHVSVDRYRYLDRIITNQGDLLQVSSEISGILPDNYHENLGSLLYELLPAGSISGAPKKKTVEIIEDAETYNRGFYTGIFGYFDGENLDSGVMIRFIENINNQLVFKSGGGITINSNLEDEYEEMIRKIYLPIY